MIKDTCKLYATSTFKKKTPSGSSQTSPAQSPAGSVQGTSSQSNASPDLHIHSECPTGDVHSAMRSPFSPSSSGHSASLSVCSSIHVTPEPELLTASRSTEGSLYSTESEVFASLNDAQESGRRHKVQVTVNAALASQLDHVSS